MRNYWVHRSWRVLFGLALISLLLAVWAGPAAQAKEKTFELTYATYISESTLMSVQARLWAKEIEKRTNGRVKVKRWHYGGAICGGAEQLGCIARGLADST